MKRRTAFTLVELLVVIAIIAVLAALVMSALSGTRSRAHALVCLSHLKQWGLATHLYALDSDDFLPNNGTPNGTSVNSGWYVDLPRVLGMKAYAEMPWRTNAEASLPRAIWFCPANTNRSNGNNLFHYCLNEHINGTGANNRPVRMAAIPGIARVVWLFDNGRRAAVAQQNNVHTNLHRRGAQFTFLDGHAARFSSIDYWDVKADKGRTNNPSLVWIPERD